MSNKERAVQIAQLMGDIPVARLNSYSPPFSHMAVDHFGPIETSPGRNRATKWYGALFTYLATSGSPCLRRFSTGSFGIPVTIHSDNGTNFVGAERELNDIIYI